MAPTPKKDEVSQSIFIRKSNEVSAMSWASRNKTRAWNLFKTTKEATDEDLEAAAAKDDDNNDKPVQYRLEAKTAKSMWWCCTPKDGLLTGIHPNQRLAMYLHWMFRVNFLYLFIVMCVMFFALVILFAALIMISGRVDPECVRIGGEPFDVTDTPFANGFALSWTTLSTVGYGSTYPALGHENNNKANCFAINFLLSMEALLGVLYSGFCGAILFGKVLRIQSHAQVVFSDPIVIRYGTGVAHDYGNGSDDDEEEQAIPNPVLEFRIVNRLYKEVGGEIMDATLNVVANITADDADKTTEGGLSVRSANQSVSSLPSDTLVHADSEDHSEAFHAFDSEHMQNTSSQADTQMEDELTSRVVSKQIFSKMIIEASDHPFFKRVWLARHELNEYSPLVKNRVRRYMRKHGGAWPRKLNNYEGIRDSLKFNQILVSLNGVSNISASDVYAQRIYDFVDINVGYQFVNLLYREDDGSLGVDVDLVNDVKEQDGGGGEPLVLE